MNMKFDVESIEKLVEAYYKKYEDFIGKLTIRPRKASSYIGRSIVPVETVKNVFTMVGKIVVDGEELFVKVPLDMKELENAFKVMLDEIGYYAENLSLDYNLENKFLGVCIDVTSKKNKTIGEKSAKLGILFCFICFFLEYMI